MAKKQYFRNKNLKRIVVTALTAGTILISTIGFNIYNNWPDLNIDNPDKNDNAISDRFDDVHALSPTGPDIITDPNDTTPPNIFNGFEQEPELGDDVIASENFDENMIKVLALLTNATRDYFESATGKTSDITHTSVDHIIPNSDGSVVFYGKGQSGTKIKRMVTTITNLSLNSYSTDPNKFIEQLATDLEIALSLPQTQYSTKIDTYYKVSNPQIAKTLLQGYLSELQVVNPTSSEVAYIQNLLSNPGKLELLITNPVSTKTDSGNYRTTFTLILSTEKYGYTTQGSIETTYQLRGDDKYAFIENYISSNSSNIELQATAQSDINRALYNINQEAKSLQDENSLTK